jgi:hypothetical protein
LDYTLALLFAALLQAIFISLLKALNTALLEPLTTTLRYALVVAFAPATLKGSLMVLTRLFAASFSFAALFFQRSYSVRD